MKKGNPFVAFAFKEMKNLFSDELLLKSVLVLFIA
jgi:hypothetical protein